MQINISFEGLKKFGVALFVAASLVSFGSSLHYMWFRHQSKDFFDVLAFDVNSRKDDIRARYQKMKADEASAIARSLQNNTPPTVSAPQAKKP